MKSKAKPKTGDKKERFERRAHDLYAAAKERLKLVKEKFKTARKLYREAKRDAKKAMEEAKDMAKLLKRKAREQLKEAMTNEKKAGKQAAKAKSSKRTAESLPSAKSNLKTKRKTKAKSKPKAKAPAKTSRAVKTSNASTRPLRKVVAAKTLGTQAAARKPVVRRRSAKPSAPLVQTSAPASVQGVADDGVTASDE
jgi:hypothetical protein